MGKTLNEIAQQLKDSPKKAQLIYAFNGTGKNRIIQLTSHSTLSSEAIAEPSPQEKKTVEFLLNHLTHNYGYWQHEEQNG